MAPGVFTHHDEIEQLVVPATRTSAEVVEWYEGEYEGQLSVDVYQTNDAVVVRSTIAGVKAENLEITLNSDVITIRGRRQLEDEVAKEDYFYQECYWGGFSRSIVLPMEVRAQEVTASLKNGVLTVVLPKATRHQAQVMVPVAAEEE